MDQNRPPRVFLVDADALARVRQRARTGDPALAPAARRLRREAEAALTEGPFSVVNKPFLPPSGDKHDYMSVGPYWWPNPDTPDGKPYIRRDGEVNPEREQYDSVPMQRMNAAVQTLALAYYIIGDERYAERAALLLDTWFLAPGTRMNPHLEYGQAIPGICDGRGIGIIDTHRLGGLIDAIGMLQGAIAWSAAHQAGMIDWFSRYLNWLTTSDKGRDEASQHNNHGTWYDAQAAAFALFTGADEIARHLLAKSAPRRIEAQITSDGRQPHELARTRSLSYSVMNLTGMFDIATLGQHVGVDLWHYTAASGASIRGALDWLIAHVIDRSDWSYQQITPFNQVDLAPLLRRAANAYAHAAYERLVAQRTSGDERCELLYPKTQQDA